jgi:hypothetical protein
VDLENESDSNPGAPGVPAPNVARDSYVVDQQEIN